MPRKRAGRAPKGSGTIRWCQDKKLWEGRYIAGRNPATGKAIRKSIYAKTQAEVQERLQKIQTEIKDGTFTEPSKITLGAWLDTWAAEYLGGVKESTQASYKGHIKNHIKPAIGGVKLQQLTPDAVQKFYNGLTKKGLSAKSIKNVHGVLNSALTQAIDDDYIKKNPCANRTLPRVVKREIKAMDSDTVIDFIKAIAGHQFESIFFIDLFSGLRQAEILGLSWKAINFKLGTIRIDSQLVKSKLDGRYYIDTAKHDKVRTIAPAPVVMSMLKQRKAQQSADQLRAGAAWHNEWGLVFTDVLGKHFVHQTISKSFKRIVVEMGHPDLTFHSLRHTFAVLSLMNGDDAKTVQTNLGHHSASFTLDVYGHTTEEMQKASAKRMQDFIESINKSSG